MTSVFRVGLTADFQVELTGVTEPILEEVFGPLPFIEYEFFPFESRAGLGSAEVAPYDAILSLTPCFTEQTFQGASRLATVARWGVGVDQIDVPACTRADVLLSNTPAAVGRPVAEAIVTLILALASRLITKDRLARTGRWDLKAQASGLGLEGKTVGSVGLGSIASEAFTLLQPFRLARKLAYDPYAPAEKAAALGVELVDLETLFRESDFVTINCPLTNDTRGLVGRALLALMKPTAYFINTARGPIVNEADLLDSLQNRRIAGAGLDVFAQEPLPADHPLTQLDNVILAPHALAWTDNLYRGITVTACQSILAVLRGDAPEYTVNREVVHQPGFQDKLNGLRERWNALAVAAHRGV